MFRLPLVLVFICTVISTSSAQEEWLTHFEQSGYIATPDYDETMSWLARLDSASAWVSVHSFGVTPQGREMPLVILSKHGRVTPEAAVASGKEIVLIQAGIHAGEIDGKDAGLMLLREIAITRTLESLADNIIILFMPMFNPDGHERRGAYNRINQNGPIETGWRTTANNLNLNRDYMKADAPEMRDWLRVFNAWRPDILIDCHATNGIDFQYNLTYAMEVFGNMHETVVEWERRLEKHFIGAMDDAGDPVAPYVFPRENSDLSKGMVDWASPPRLSTGYAAVRNRANLLIETHMLKPYKDRVFSTYRLLIEVLSYINTHRGSLRRAVRDAERDDIARFASGDTSGFPLRFAASDTPRMYSFRGYESEIREGSVSGTGYIRWNHDRPVTVDIPLFDDVQPTLHVRIPQYYVIPQEWSDVLDILRLHDVRLRRLAQPTRLVVETTLFDDINFRSRPYESRMTVNIATRTRVDSIDYPAGTVVVDPAQPSGRAAINLLEADAPDSFVFWGFFNAIFEKKEYYEAYIMEEVASRMLDEQADLRREFEQRLASDTAFAASPRARLDFFYQRSPYHDSKLNVYPVGRCMEKTEIATIPEHQWKELHRSSKNPEIRK